MRIAARLFQAACRRRKARREYLVAREGVVLLQGTIRSKQQRRTYLQQRAAAILFQVTKFTAVIARFSMNRLIG